MKKLRLDFDNRIISIVSDQKTVIAYMDNELKKKDFRTFFPDKSSYESAENVTFDFENCLLCLKHPVNPVEGGGGYRCVKRIPMPAIRQECDRIMNAVGWSGEY